MYEPVENLWMACVSKKHGAGLPEKNPKIPPIMPSPNPAARFPTHVGIPRYTIVQTKRSE